MGVVELGIKWRATLRVSVWLLAVFIGLYPVCHALHQRPTIQLVWLAELANQKLLFRDYFFIVVVLVSASFGNIIYCIVNGDRLANWMKGLFALATLYYLYVLVYGVSRFSELTEMTAPIQIHELHDDLWFMGLAVFVTLLAELAISLTENVEHTHAQVVGWPEQE
ncbi:hypothetical protein CO683_39080 [Bradyrhizobium ottawaense]|nr:hypothetical protein [Bradyrhizobium sp. CCBAU 11386]MDA9534761.1 hypothetical protein [Bradyrhizobium sp. CCBAU 21362]PDT64310.1 hypothetical protein CO683_39080 [Bradyrhizobium ottawaense]